MIPQDTIEKIIGLAHVEEVIGDFVALRKAGTNFKGCCPFHDEKTPSFVVSPAKGIYKCFGCGKAGNAVTFIKEHEKCSYFDAIRYLGRKYHVDIVETELTEEEKQRRDIRESLQIVNQYAADFFEKSMWETEEGKSVGLAYFVERGFTEETIRKFRLGYSPQKKDAFTETAEKSGYKLEYLQKVGLSTVGENYKLDRFHGRVMFPIMSVSGTVIGFGGRVMTPANEHVQSGAKYINSPESEVYNKSRTLYGISYAKNEIVRKEECILVEGYTDVISMHQAGITNVVASSGTSLTNDQIDLIKRFTENIVIIYDGDNAGIKAATRGIDMILEKDLNVRILLLPNGEDPDTFAKNRTSEEIAEYITANKTDFLTFRTRLAAKETENDPIQRAQFINSIAGTIAKIPNQIKRAVFIQECGKILNIDNNSFTAQVNKILGHPTSLSYKQTQTQKTIDTPVTKKQVDKILANEQDIIRLLILYGQRKIYIDNSDSLYEITKHFWEQQNRNPNNTPKKYNEPNPDFNGLVKDYIFNELSNEISEGETFHLLNESEKKIFDEYYSHYEEKQENINDYLRDFVDAERIAEILSDERQVDVFYWNKNKNQNQEEKLEEERKREDEQLSILLKETILEYIKRRYELKKEILGKSSDSNNYRMIDFLNQCINVLSNQLHHYYR
ncbi:MAG: DNA primase [Bacteroidales bacterium]|nr:DNA primase [Bacteroidales bacterium]